MYPQSLTVWRGEWLFDVAPSDVLSTDLIQDANDGLWYPSSEFGFQFAPPPPPPMSFEVCYTQPSGAKTCAKATGPAPALIGLGLLCFGLGVFAGVKLVPLLAGKGGLGALAAL